MGDHKAFEKLPLSKQTQLGLSKSHFIEMTDIQRSSLVYSLCGRDVLGAAKTGSGKTLAFVIPVLECLLKSEWSSADDGLGALIISPTRELAMQIFEVLRKVGRYHSFSAGLLIGGKDLKQEQERITRMNILVCTPGRLLQHMDQTPEFVCDNLQILVLDEADRILDSGFEKTINAIVQNLPKTRQTLLFSATQTKSVKDLARLSLHNAEYISAHEAAVHSTPKNLTQRFIVCELDRKLDILFSFIRTHLKTKILVFLSSCKQVRFVFETFCKLQPGVPLMCLHGKQKQAKRIAIFEQFCRKQEACLFATDIAARGLDFPAVDWVVQVDCPEDAATYIHRVGRTARYDSKGQALLLLTPSERDGMIELLTQKKVPIDEIKVNPAKTTSIRQQLSGLCSQSPEIKYLGQKAFICYLRSIYLQANKQVFDVNRLPVDAFAESLGLPGAPKIKFVKKLSAQKNASRQAAAAEQADSDSERRPKNNSTNDHDDDHDDDDDDDKRVPNLRSRKSDLDSQPSVPDLGLNALEADTESESDQESDAEDNRDVGSLSHKSSHALKNADMRDLDGDDDDDRGDGGGDDKAAGSKTKPRTKIDRMFAKTNLTVLSKHYAKLKEDDNDNDNEGDDELLTIKRANHDIDESELPEHNVAAPSHRKILELRRKAIKNRGHGEKMVFDDDGNPLRAFEMETLEDFEAKQDIASRQQEYLEQTTAVMRDADTLDRAVAKQKLKERKLNRKIKLKTERRETDDDDDDNDNEDNDNDNDNDDNDNDDDDGQYDFDMNESDTDTRSKHQHSSSSSSLSASKKSSLKRSASASDDTDAPAKSSAAKEPKAKRSKTLPRLPEMNTESLEDLALQLLQD
eukprot:jgi/Hompol1/1172/HPOL_003007-RA